LYREIRLQDLSASEALDMLESLLRSDDVPPELSSFVKEKAEGNPFYLEELINSLMDSETLVKDNGNWRLAGPIKESSISPTIHGIISGRLDRLERETKRVLQEASVIGRSFLYDILKQITKLKDKCDRCLIGLERLDMIRTKSLEPDLEYIFKHALTQEVVYNGLLKKERREIHERIGLVMEEIFEARLSEFYETLAFHFKQGLSLSKAVDYLMKSGEKSLGRYAVEESDIYFRDAFGILANKPIRTEEENVLLIDLITRWSLVYYYRGDFKGQVELLDAHRTLAESIDDQAKLAMFYAWYGFSLYSGEKYKNSYEYLRKAFELGEKVGDERAIGYACTWLSWTCAEMGSFDEALSYGEKAQDICKQLPSDHYLFFKSLGGIGVTYFHIGKVRKVLETGKTILEYGQRHSNIRSIVMGHFVTALGFAADGNYQSASEAASRGIQIAQDPFYLQMSRCLLGVFYALGGRFQQAKEVLQGAYSYGTEYGCEVIATNANHPLGLIDIAEGHMSEGLKRVEESLRSLQENNRRSLYSPAHHALGQVYLQIVDKSAKVSLATMAKNIGFILKNVPSAEKKAKYHFDKAIEVAKEIGAEGTLGAAYLDLGRLHNAKGRREKARDNISKAIEIFEKIEADVFLKQSREILDSLL
jgi:tetratricopeptide (TPR) repeat protein